jgi:hypothetical protein
MSAMPSVPTLLRAWGLMMGLTCLSLWAAVADQGLFPAVMAMAAGLFKAILILWIYLNLRTSGSSWKAVFVGFLMVIAALVLGSYGVGILMG